MLFISRPYYSFVLPLVFSCTDANENTTRQTYRYACPEGDFLCAGNRNSFCRGRCKDQQMCASINKKVTCIAVCEGKYIWDRVRQECRSALTCADISCPTDESCLEGEDVDAKCIRINPRTCSIHQIPCEGDFAFDPTTLTCLACEPCPSDGPYTGQIYPVTTEDGSCICETRVGYFVDPKTYRARLCGTDEWTEIDAYRATQDSNCAISTNSRCQ